MKQHSYIKPIFIILKELLYICGFKEPFTGGLGSYSLFLMVASYVQKQQEYCEKSKIENSLSEYLMNTLSNYSDPNSYFTPIITNDPGNASPFINDRESFDNFIQLVVVDPLNGMNNVAYNTHVDRLNLCDCIVSCSPLYRMFYETKENMSN